MFVKGNILVTGANRGIGLSFVKHLCLLNTVERVFAGCRSPENATDLIKLQKTNSKIRIIKLDVQNDLCIQLAAEQISFEIGEKDGINCLINNAGVLEMSGADFETPNRSTFWRHFDVNTIGAVVTTRLFVHLLRISASPVIPSLVINISSSAGSLTKVQSHTVIPSGNIIYGMSKAALNHFTVSLASMEKQNNIFAISLTPTWTKTKIGGPAAPNSSDKSVKLLLDVIYRLRPSDSGKCFDSDGKIVPF